MAYLCVDREGEYIADNIPTRDFFEWSGWINTDGETCSLIAVPKGTIKKLIGKEMTWEDEPINLAEHLKITNDMNATKFFCPDCGREFKQGEFEYNYETGDLKFLCPFCSWIGIYNNLDMNDEDDEENI